MSLAGPATLQGGQSAAVPRLAEPFEPRPAADQASEAGGKQKKRSLFGFGKKKTGVSKQTSPTIAEPPTAATTVAHTMPVPSPAAGRLASSPIRSDFPHMMTPSSPARNLSSSPRLSSPAGSQIFERDVQESNTMIPNSPAIPSHIQTENHIPPVLDASSEAITDDHLDPDTVEIITHTSHQPAAFTVTGVPLSPANETVGSWADELAVFSDRDAADSASNYGFLDSTDVRRLSFISFADVVQAEHTGAGNAGTGDSIHLAGLTSLPSVGLANRSPSPIRSPVSSAGAGASPPTSKSGSVKGLDLSPARKPLGSPATTAAASAHLPTVGGELNIETMTQALRRTGSKDLSSFKSIPTSPVDGGPSR